jgi:DNA-directed RNA polymerase specialized sigma24 family protein
MPRFADASETPRPFPSTRHSIVTALRDPDPARRREAFGTLVAGYWKPVYRYLRLRWGCDADAAQDLTQEFFTEAMLRGFLGGYDPTRARFRTYLRSCLDHFAANAERAERRLKRGGGAQRLALDFADAEEALVRAGQVTESDAEERFHQDWMSR